MHGRRILIVEDEYFIATDLAEALAEYGAIVLGPRPTLEGAQAFVSKLNAAGPNCAVDAVLLDINLSGMDSWPVADALVARRIPVVLMTGYDRTYGPDRFRRLAWCQKPVTIGELVLTIERAIGEAEVVA